jgi:RNase P subunit RPR2
MYNYTQGYQVPPLSMENYYYAYMNLCAQGLNDQTTPQYPTSEMAAILQPCEEKPKVEKKAFKCRSCDKIFKSEKQALTHHKNIHEKTTQVTCSKCGRVFSNKYVLKKHNTRIHPSTASIN